MGRTVVTQVLDESDDLGPGFAHRDVIEDEARGWIELSFGGGRQDGLQAGGDRAALSRAGELVCS